MKSAARRGNAKKLWVGRSIGDKEMGIMRTTIPMHTIGIRSHCALSTSSMAIGFAWTSALLVIFVSVLIYDKMGGFQSKNHFPVDGRVPLQLHPFSKLWLIVSNSRQYS